MIFLHRYARVTAWYYRTVFIPGFWRSRMASTTADHVHAKCWQQAASGVATLLTATWRSDAVLTPKSIGKSQLQKIKSNFELLHEYIQIVVCWQHQFHLPVSCICSKRFTYSHFALSSSYQMKVSPSSGLCSEATRYSARITLLGVVSMASSASVELL